MVICGVALVAAAPGWGGRIDQALLKLEPDERARQVCDMKGLEVVRHDKRLLEVDRVKSSIFGVAQVDGTVVTAKGGAVRSSHHWYALSFSCTVTADRTVATSFKYELGREIPRNEWETLGLWP